MAHDDETGVIRLARPIPAGGDVQLTQATRDGIIAGAKRSLQDALAAYPGDKPDLGLFFSCAARSTTCGGMR